MMAMSMLTAACGNLGVGEPECVPPGRDVLASNVTGANILTVQAVPTARYTPCLNGLRLGWDSVEWFAENGRAGFRILRNISPFLTATVTRSCDVSNARPVPSNLPDVERFEDVELQQADVTIIIVPTGERPLVRARILAEEFSDTQVEDRPVTFVIDEEIDQQVRPRVNLALLRADYVWIIDELDAEEDTVELRSNFGGVAGTRIDPDDALELIEDSVPETFYRGSWYFTFDGGCITYDFDSDGTLAETIAADAEIAIGFFPAYRLVELAEDAGFDIVGEGSE
jgi:hypothetical protein